MTLPMIAVLLTPLVGELQLEAETLDLSQRAIIANDVTLHSGSLRISAQHLKSAASGDCDGSILFLDHAVAAWHEDGALEAQALQLCTSSRALQLKQIRGRHRQVTVHAQSATGHLDRETLTLRNGRVSTCGCKEPPWSVTFREARADADGAWLNWPVLRLGSTPVLTVPTWYLPYGRRRSGLLAPSFSLDQGTRPSFKQPVYWVTGPLSDLTVTGGLFEGDAPLGGAELRWARSTQELSTFEVEMVGRSARVVSAIAERWGGWNLSLAGEALTASEQRRRFVTAWLERQVSDTALTGMLGLTGESATLDLSGEWAQTTRDVVVSPSLGWGRGHLAWAPDLPGIAPRLDGRILYGGVHRGERFGQLEMGGELATQLWMGALSVRPYLGGGWTRALTSRASATSYIIGYESRLDWQRVHRSVHHRAALILDGNWGEGYGETDHPDPWMRAGAHHTHGISIENRWSGVGRYLYVRFRQGVQHTPGDSLNLDSPGTEVTISMPTIQARGLHYGLNYVWSEMSVRPLASGQLSASYVRVGPNARRPSWIRWSDRYRYFAFDPMKQTLDSLLLEGRFSVGPVQLYWAPGLDLQEGHFIGQAGGLKFIGRCQCWTVELDVQHERATRFPNVMLEIDLRRP